ncbi:MAG: TRAP transporter small permease subunit [Rhodobacteraceae bacterium]|nr:TRAP transporter small permease subunit [Paracoccaceae bacterium]
MNIGERYRHLIEWLIPAGFILCGGWVIWHMPAFILDFIPPSDESLYGQIHELHTRKDVTPGLPGLFGGLTDIVDWAAILLMPVAFIFGISTVRIAPMEFQEFRAVDRIAIFIGRITMILIISMTSIMLYEVFLRYALERPTLWANEMTLWTAGFVFLFSGLYAMQQRCHIRIFILYEAAPRWLQHVFDIISVFLLCTFAFFMIYGSFRQVFVTKFYRWEMFGTAFDPPIPATVQPMILIVIALVALQAVANLIADWNSEPDSQSGDDLDAGEIEAIRKTAGAE